MILVERRSTGREVAGVIERIDRSARRRAGEKGAVRGAQHRSVKTTGSQRSQNLEGEEKHDGSAASNEQQRCVRDAFLAEAGPLPGRELLVGPAGGMTQFMQQRRRLREQKRNQRQADEPMTTGRTQDDSLRAYAGNTSGKPWALLAATPARCYSFGMIVPFSAIRQPAVPTLAFAVWIAVAPLPSSPALAQAEAPEPQRIEEVVVSAPEPRYVAPTTRDRIGRIWAPVLINGKGPYRLVLDTGATRSAVIQRVVDDAGLPVRAKPVRLRGVTGSAIVPAVLADTLEFGELVIENATLPVVADAFGGADGVLGAEGMKNKRIHIEFLKDRISIVRSHGAAAPAGFSTVPFKYGVNRGLRVEVMVGPVRTTALIDSGAQVTVGNLALRKALARRRGAQDQYDDAIIGVTEDVQQAVRVRIPSIVAGDLLVKNAEIMFSDLHIFEHWQLVSKPALIIGMDVLGALDTLVIDYRRNELQIKVRR